MQNEKNDNTERDLFAELSAATEKKTADTSAPKSFSWDDGKKAEPLPLKKEEKTSTGDQDPDSEGKLTPEQIQDAAEASAAGVELITSLVSEAVINLKYYFKFTADERKELDEVILDKPKQKLDEAEELLRNRYDRLMTSRDKKLEKISMSDKARERLEKSFARYTESTGKTFLTPKSELGICIAEAVLKTTIAAVLD